MARSRIVIAAFFILISLNQLALAEESLSLDVFIGEKVTAPSGVIFNEINKKGDAFEIKGTAKNNKQIAEVMKALEKTKRIDRVDLISARLDQGKQTFSMLAKEKGHTRVKTPPLPIKPRKAKLQYTDKQKKILDEHRKRVRESGSNLELTILSLKRNKFQHDILKAAQKENDMIYKWASYDEYSPSSLNHLRSSRSLKSKLFGDFSNRRSHTFSDQLNVLSGQRAIDETLQINSIGTGPRNNTGKLLTSVSDIEPLKVKTHPWDKMLSDVTPAKKPDILKLAPKDHFLIYFKEAVSLSKLEDSLKELFSFGNEYFQLDEMLSLREKVSKRLGIEKFEALEPLVSHVAFISEDISFYPRTNYAVAMKFKTNIFKNVSEYFSAENTMHGDIGDYFVVASSAELFQRIQGVFIDSSRSMYESKDFAYMLSVLDKRRDGFAYFSEDFILKLVSPQYRINSARRNKAIDKLEVLQYSVFAYKIITGSWPKSLEEIVEKGYFSEKSIESTFSLRKDNFVEHSEWGTIQQAKAVSEVEIDKITKAEKDDYKRFRDGYQRFWRRFFDPIGISFSTSDQIFTHTVILPLIEQSEYKVVNAFSGGDPVNFKSLKKPLRVAPISFFSKFDFDKLLISTHSNFRRRARNNKEELTEEQIKEKINKDFNKSIKSKEALNVFGIIGNELLVGLGSNIPFALANLADFDIFIGLQLKKPERFKKLVNSIYRDFYNNFSSRRQGMFFQLSSTEPLKKRIQ